MSAIPLVFATQEAFRAALAEHLEKGGAVVEVAPRPALQARVVVALELTFCKQRILLDADVVQETPGGVAVQFLEPAEALRRRLVGFAGLEAEGEAEAAASASAHRAGLDHAEVDLDPSDEPIPELGTPGTGHAEPHLD